MRIAVFGAGGVGGYFGGRLAQAGEEVIFVARGEHLRAMQRDGLQVDTPEDIWTALWRKFLFIVAVSGVGAVARAPIGVIRALPETRQMLVQAMQEVAELANRRQISLEPDIVTKTMASIDAMAPGVVPSMQRDILEGRPSELEAQSGAVVRMGSQAGIATPLHSFIYASLLPQEMRARAGNPLTLS